MKLTAYDREGKQVWMMVRKEDLLVNAKTFKLPEWWTWDRPGRTVSIKAEFDDGTWTTFNHPDAH